MKGALPIFWLKTYRIYLQPFFQKFHKWSGAKGSGSGSGSGSDSGSGSGSG